MKKPKLLQLALSLAMLIAISTTNSFANTKTKFAPIVDASQMNMTAINKLNAVKPAVGGAPTIGSIIPWVFYNDNPSDEICTNLATGGNGAGGVCKWLECNGQTVSPVYYPDYIAVTASATTPNFKGRMPLGRKSSEMSKDAYDTVLESQLDFKLLYNYEKGADGYIDGAVGFRAGLYSEGLTPPEGIPYTTHTWETDSYISNKFPVRYLIRVSK